MYNLMSRYQLNSSSQNTTRWCSQTAPSRGPGVWGGSWWGCTASRHPDIPTRRTKKWTCRRKTVAHLHSSLALARVSGRDRTIRCGHARWLQYARKVGCRLPEPGLGQLLHRGIDDCEYDSTANGFSSPTRRHHAGTTVPTISYTCHAVLSSILISHS